MTDKMRFSEVTFENQIKAERYVCNHMARCQDRLVKALGIVYLETKSDSVRSELWLYWPQYRKKFNELVA